MEINKKITFKSIIKSIFLLIEAFFIIILGDIIGEILVYPMSSSNNDSMVFASMYASFIGIWIITIVITLINKKDRYLFSYLKFHKKRVKTSILLGLVFGICINLFIAIIAMVHGDINLYFNKFEPLTILLFIICVTIQSGAEELISRWFIYQKIKKYIPGYPIVAILLNSLFFSVLHLGNNGITYLSFFNILFVGILYSLIIYYFNSFWGAVIAHSSWNFCQSIILGLPNSGVVSSYSIFKLDASTATNSFTYNVGFGIEGTILTNVIIITACIMITYFAKKNRIKLREFDADEC